MGVMADALAILLGGLFGSRLQKKAGSSYAALGIGIMIISLVGFLENMFVVQGASISSEHLLVVLFAYLLGTKMGEWLKLEDRVSNLGKGEDATWNAITDATLFFGVGGLQISGPLVWGIHGDSSQLLIKSLVDLPFAITFGAVYGKAVAWASVPVAVTQLLIAGAAYGAAEFFSDALVMQVCAMGYLLLFFSGFNLATDGKHKISNMNSLPGMVLVIGYHLLIGVVERIL